MNQAVWRILEKNVRVPEKVLGDVQALLAAVRFGERDLLRLVGEYGLEEMKDYMADILDSTEQLTRAEISSYLMVNGSSPTTSTTTASTPNR